MIVRGLILQGILMVDIAVLGLFPFWGELARVIVCVCDGVCVFVCECV